MRRLGLACGLLAAISLPLAPAAHAAPGAAVAAASQASPEALALARRYVRALHMEDTVAKMLEQMDIMALMGINASDHPDIKAMADANREATVAMLPKLIEGMTPVIATTFTEDELRAMVTFYEGPTGQSILAKTPALTQASMSIMVQLMPTVLSDMMERYCAKTTCSAEMKAKLGKQPS
jgi:hypothetical protein